VGWLTRTDEVHVTRTLEVPALAARPTLDRIDAWRARRARRWIPGLVPDRSRRYAG
jgi:hypothetical protein